MLIYDIFLESYIALTANKIRTGLTVLGIIIGIGSVIVMIAVGVGAQRSIEKSIESIGSNLLMVRPGFTHVPGQSVNQGQGSAQSLTREDADAISNQVSYLSGVAPVISENYQIIVGPNNTRTNVIGTVPEYIHIRNIALEQGIFFTNSHQDRLAKVAIIGFQVHKDLFGQEDVIGKKIYINGIEFLILGVAQEKGSSGLENSDDAIYIPITTAIQYLTGSDALSLINISVTQQEDMERASQAVQNILLRRHNLQDVESSDFRIMNQSDVVETASSITETFTLLLGSVAGISLVVGGIGIMNMMLTTVTERTREIGLRKALGAKRKDINRQFLFESIVLTFFGGGVGVFFGWSISWGLTYFFEISTEVSLTSIFLAFGVSTIIGIIFGYYPSYRASSLRPIESLRYE